MIRILALACLLFPATTLLAQDLPGQPGKDMPLVAHFAGGALHGWEVAEGESVIDKEGVTLGGKAQTKLRLTAPVGDRFRLHLDYRIVAGGGQPVMHWETNRPNSYYLMQSAKGVDFTLNGTRGSWHSSSMWNYSQRSLEGSSSSGGLFGGTGSLRQMYILIPAGTTLHLRAVDVNSTAVLVPSSSALVSALVILGVVLASICLLGWLLNRRRVPTTSRPVS